MRRIVVLALLVTGCPRTVEMDAGPPFDAGTPTDSSYDPVAGNLFEGDLVLDSARMMRLDGAMLRAGASPCRPAMLGRVNRVVDGDTIHVTADDGTFFNLSVRMIGIDTPEIAHPGTPAECYGADAAAFTSRLLDQLVWLTFDNDCFDTFDRLLAYVHIGGGGGDLFQRQLLRRGFATVLTVGGNRTYRTVFEADENAAQAADAGLWAACF